MITVLPDNMAIADSCLRTGRTVLYSSATKTIHTSVNWEAHRVFQIMQVQVLVQEVMRNICATHLPEEQPIAVKERLYTMHRWS